MRDDPERGRPPAAGSPGYQEASVIFAGAESRSRGAARRIAAGCWCYTVIGTLLLLARADAGATTALADWIATPLQLIAIALCGRVVFGASDFTRPVRTVAALAGAYGLVIFTASVFYNIFRPLGREPGLVVTDVLYMVAYGVYAVVLGASYRFLGGSFRSRRFWADSGIIVATLMLAFWAVLLEPIRANGNLHIDLFFTLGYALLFTVLMAMAAMMCIQMPSLAAFPSLLWLGAAGLIDALWEVPWLAGAVADGTRLAPLYNVGDALCFAMIATATAVAPHRTGAGPCFDIDGGAERSAHNFVPAVATLLAILLIAGAFTGHRTTDSWLLLGLGIACMVLIVSRHLSVRRELAELTRALVVREADLRLAELVRLSRDLILIVHRDGTVRFASAAAGHILGLSAGELPGRRFASMLGPAAEPALGRFLEELLQSPSRTATLELTVDGGAEPARTLHVSGLNQLDNNLIGGLSVTIADVTGQRALEREVLGVATRERVRIAADIHDGIGQELVGISMLLQGAATGGSGSADAVRGQLGAIVRHLNSAIGAVRTLARGLSPLQVVRGSLGHALRRLAEDESETLAILVEIDAALEDLAIDDVVADHVYRIAHEAVRNAVKHSGGHTVRVGCEITDECLVLSVTDDGRLSSDSSASGSGIGLRLMQYRAQMIRGSLSLESTATGGTEVCLSVPLRHLSRA
jgi:PAS domain S-box-containing protein